MVYLLHSGVLFSRRERNAHWEKSPLLSETLEYIDRGTSASFQLVKGDLVFIDWCAGESTRNSFYDPHLYKLCDEARIKSYSVVPVSKQWRTVMSMLQRSLCWKLFVSLKVERLHKWCANGAETTIEAPKVLIK